MAITPTKANELNEADNKEIRDIERDIDSFITQRFGRPGNNLFIKFGYSSDKILNEIIRIYEGAGWKIREDEDPVGGNYFVFTPRDERLGGRK